MEDELLFAAEEGGESTKAKHWKVLVVDDEPEIHSVTRLALEGLRFRGRDLMFDSAYSGKEAVEMMRKDPSYALVFMDVIMESDTAGLDAIRSIREDLRNRFVRIILRTGQPGQSPERDVIMNYDINDYKAKTELTATKLFTAVVTALRAYDDIIALETHRRGLEKVIQSLGAVFQIKSLDSFITGVLMQLVAMLDLERNAMMTCTFAGAGTLLDSKIVAGTGEFETHKGQNVIEVVEPGLLRRISEVVGKKESYFGDDHAIIYFGHESGVESFIYLEGHRFNNPADRQLVERFLQNVSIAYRNVAKYEEFMKSQAQA